MSQSGSLGLGPITPSTIVETLTGNTGSAVGPAANNINVVGDGTTIDIVGNPGTNTLTVSYIGASGSVTIAGDTGTPQTGTSFTFNATPTSGSSVSFEAQATDVIELNVTDAFHNTIIGYTAGNGSISGGDNTSLGYGTLASLTTGRFNAILGDSAGDNITSGGLNVLIGSGAGTGYTSSESHNIILGPSAGTVATSGEMRLGDFTNTATTYVAGVSGVTVSNINAVTINTATGQLGSEAFPSSGISTINGDSSFVTGSTVNLLTGFATYADGTSEFSGNGTTTMQLTFTDGNANVGIGINALSQTPGSGGIGIQNVAIGAICLPVLSQGQNNVGIGTYVLQNLIEGYYNTVLGYFSGSNYTLAESDNIIIGARVAGIAGENGVIRIGNDAFVHHAYIAGINGNTVSNTMMVTIDSSTNQLGTAAIPSGGSVTLTGDAGTAITGSSLNIITGLSTNNAGGSIEFTGDGSATLTLNTSDANRNTFIGIGAGISGASGLGNTAVGQRAMGNGGGPSGNSNSAFGQQSLASITSGAENCAFGDNALYSLLTGTNNSALGQGAGTAYTGAESNNIVINDGGVIGDSAVIRISTNAGAGANAATACYIGGITGVTVTGAAVLVSASDQLGVAISSRKFKDNIRDMDNYSSQILSLRPTIFNYKGSEETTGGLIAEEVADIMPALVVYDKQGDPQTVKYHELPALLLNELQKALKRIEALELKYGK